MNISDRVVIFVIALSVLGGWMVPLPAGFAEFRNLNEADAETAVRALAANHGPSIAWSYLTRALMPNGALVDSKSDAHALAHTIGEELYRGLGEVGIDVCDESFTYGCYHGYVRALFEDVGEGPRAAEVCAKTPNEGGCAHGFGHALPALGGGSIEDVLRSCDSLFTTFAFACWEGAIMEYLKTYRMDDGRDLWDFCAGLSPRYQESCASSLPGRMPMNSVGEVAVFCSRGETTLAREACAAAFGADLVHRSHGDSRVVREGCSLLIQELQFKCFSAAARLIVERQQADAIQDAQALCELVPAQIVACEEQITNARRDFQ